MCHLGRGDVHCATLGWMSYRYLLSPAGLLCNFVRKHLTRGFLCVVLDLPGTLWPLLIPEYSGIKRRGTPFLGLRNPDISHFSDKYLFLFMSHMVKGDCLQLPL